MKEWELKYFEAKKKLVDLVESKNIPLSEVSLSFSGGKDSTLMMRMIEDIGWKNKVKVVFADTYMEFETINKFIKQKEQEGWIINRTKPRIPAPLIYKKYGKPLKSKYDSEMIYRLQSHNFDFKNDIYKDFNELYIKYPKCKSALQWLTSENRTLNCSKWFKKELQNIDIKVSNKCCTYLKKYPIIDFNKEYNIKLNIVGIRKAEGGIRSIAYKGCISNYDNNKYKFFPLLYFSDNDVNDCIKELKIEISEAYTKYGCERTGCVGCPFGNNYNQEVEILKKWEPNKYLAVNNLFGEVYKIQDKKRVN